MYTYIADLDDVIMWTLHNDCFDFNSLVIYLSLAHTDLDSYSLGISTAVYLNIF